VQLKGNAAKLRKSLAEIHVAARAGDQERYAVANLKLHRGIMEASGNAVLVQVWDSLGFETRIRVMVARHAKDMIELAARHDPMIDALEKGDAKLAGQLLRNHSEQFVEENLANAKNQSIEVAANN
jgi:DNA-binding GntR family transcriptional regulator